MNMNTVAILRRVGTLLFILMWIPFVCVFVGMAQEFGSAGIGFEGINQWIIVSLLAGLLVLNVQTRFFYPDPCCNYFSLDDQIAFEWIRENTSTQALFLISAAKSP